MKDDAISRAAAIDVLSLGKEILSRVLDDMDVVGTDREKYSWGLKLIESNIKDIEDLPSVQPQRKTGKWIHGREMAREIIWDCTTAIFYEGWTCSECGCLVEKEREPWYKYCPNCGAKIEGTE